MLTNNKVNNFTDLKVWQLSHSIVLRIYQVTKTFPREEMFGLISQLRRAAVSVTSNIAEGFYRSTAKDKMHFYIIAIGSVAELRNQLLIAKDLNYLEITNHSIISKDLIEIHKMCNGLLKTAASRP